jgi:dihydrodipicolinate synthase/N-acetylneuraminate lyase
MKAVKLPRGLIVDLITPLDDRGGIDGEGLDSLLRKVVPYADGILLASPEMGEGRGLDMKVKLDLLEKATASIQGGIPMFFWISGDSVEATKQVLTHLGGVLESSNYKGMVFWLDSPLFYHSNRGLYDHYQDLTLNTRYPLVLFNDPGVIKSLKRPFKRINIRTKILKDLGGIGKIQGLVFRGPISRANNYQKALNTRPDFRIYDGDEMGFLEHPSLSGVVSAGANVAPRTWSTVTRASLGMLKENREEPDYLNQIWDMGKLLRDMMRVYGRSPVPIVKKALADVNLIRYPACTPTTEPFHERDNPLAEFISTHNID